MLCTKDTAKGQEQLQGGQSGGGVNGVGSHEGGWILDKF